MAPQVDPQIPPPPAERPETPVPFGVDESTGEVRLPLSAVEAAEVDIDPRAIQERGNPKKKLAVIPTIDAKDLKQAGWGIVFASDADPAIRAALDPLIRLREEQVGSKDYFKIFSGDQGVLHGQSAINWLASKGVGLAVVDPENGVPYHLLLVGSPARISFEFQYTLDLQWSVGRLDFDTAAEFAAYAKSVVEYETTAVVPHAKKAAMWMPSNGDIATNLLCNDVGLPFFERPLGKRQGFELTSFFAAQATKATLTDIFTGAALSGGVPPALLFTGSHGLEVRVDDPAIQRERQGALITQEWKPGKPVGSGACFTAADVPSDAKLQGLICVVFACFGGGCPEKDNYPAPGAAPRDLTPQPIVARLPQRLLANGALAVIGHVDRAWSFSFQSNYGLPQNQVLRSVIEGIMLGLPVGLAMDFVNLQWGTLAAQLGITAGQRAAATTLPAALANLVIARDDARNYALFGDPAVRFRIDKMT